MTPPALVDGPGKREVAGASEWIAAHDAAAKGPRPGSSEAEAMAD